MTLFSAEPERHDLLSDRGSFQSVLQMLAEIFRSAPAVPANRRRVRRTRSVRVRLADGVGQAFDEGAPQNGAGPS
jgi:hypothetical protein